MAPDAARQPAQPTAHLHSSAEVARRLGVDLDQGLAADEVTERRARHGPNRLPEAPPRSWASRLLAPFRDFMILVLLAAALLSGAVGDAVDALAIVVILLLNATISIAQEWRADRALEALGRLAAPQATVHRDGQPALVEADHLVPGDVVLLEAGNVVPADLRLHRVAQLRVDESALTGESLSVEKHSAHLPPLAGGDYALGDLVNMAFKGTIVTHGRATGVAVATGSETALGRVAALLQDGDRSTPLQRRLEAFGRRLALVVLAICALVFTTGVLRGEPVLLMALTAISLAVAAIPEALPAVVTVLLALGARRLARANALVRRLPSVETLGSVTAICTDKTGTLTRNRMQVQTTRSWGASDERLWTAAVLCNDAHRGAQGWVGDPTETALTEHADASGLDAAAIQQRRPRLHEHPFDSERKCMSTVHAGGEPGHWQLFVKGAPEAVLARCSAMLGADGVQALDGTAVLQAAQALAREGMRVLAVAERDGSGDPTALDASALEQELVLLGLVALRDPPRPEARAAVAECRAAGIRPIMITGDHPQTALAIARDLGIAEADADDAAVLTGAEIARLGDAALTEALERVSVYARVDPAQKIRIVAALQAQGEVVAMTGDGVNDAPALKAKEKELTRLSDRVARERRALPRVRLEQDYVFDAPAGARRLSELFQGRRQLLVQHFIFGPGWEQGCKNCSFMADHLDGIGLHLAHRDIALLVVSRAPLAEIERFRRRMGWAFAWVSSHGNDFNRDFHVSVTPEERARRDPLQPPRDGVPAGRSAGHQRLRARRRGRGVPHLLDLRPRRGGDDGRLPSDRPHVRGARRGGPGLRPGMGAPPRPLRATGRAGAWRRLLQPPLTRKRRRVGRHGPCGVAGQVGAFGAIAQMGASRGRGATRRRIARFHCFPRGNWNPERAW